MRRQSWWHVVAANSKANGNARLVLFVLSTHATRNGYVGIPRTMIGRLCNLSDKSVRVALKKLVKLKEIFPFWTREGRGNYNIYHLTLPTTELVDTKTYRVTVVPLPPPVEFPPLRLLEEPPDKLGL